QPVLVVANHMSWLDPLLLSATGATAFIAKRDIEGWPLVGRFVGNAGGVFIDRVDYAGLDPVIRHLGERLARRAGPICFFPEGTTNDGTALLPFATSFFEAAIQP